MEPLPQAVTTRSTPYRPDPRLLALASWLGDPVEAADFPETRLRFRNDRAAAQVGLESLAPAEWIAHFGRFVPLPDNFPSRSRCAITGTSSVRTTPSWAMGAASPLRNCATRTGA
jgi:hypothetical protein